MTDHTICWRHVIEANSHTHMTTVHTHMTTVHTHMATVPSEAPLYSMPLVAAACKDVTVVEADDVAAHSWRGFMRLVPA